MTRRLALLAAIAAAAFAWLFMRRTVVVVDEPRLTYIATAHQLGVVGYRDPVGVIARDGSRIAYSEGRHLYEELTTGGARVELAEAAGQIRHVAPGSEGEWIFEDAATSPRWWIAKAASPKRPLFSTAAIEVSLAGGTRRISVDALRQLSLSPDGRAVVAIASSQAGADILRIALDLARSDLVHTGTGLAAPAWTATGEVACIVTTEGRPRLSMPCGQPPIAFEPDVDVVGPLAFAPASPVVFFRLSESSRYGGSVERRSLHAGGEARHDVLARQLRTIARRRWPCDVQGAELSHCCRRARFRLPA